MCCVTLVGELPIRTQVSLLPIPGRSGVTSSALKTFHWLLLGGVPHLTEKAHGNMGISFFVWSGRKMGLLPQRRRPCQLSFCVWLHVNSSFWVKGWPPFLAFFLIFSMLFFFSYAAFVLAWGLRGIIYLFFCHKSSTFFSRGAGLACSSFHWNGRIQNSVWAWGGLQACLVLDYPNFPSVGKGVVISSVQTCFHVVLRL